jgi:phosphomannomutase
VETLRHRYASAHIDTSDGLKVFFDDQYAWAHIRPSNTEPILRVVSEALEKSTAEALNERILAEAGLNTLRHP